MMHGFIPPERFFPYLTWTDIQAMPDKANVFIIQPVGAIEQHGPHLPLVVDAAIGAAVVGQALEKLDPIFLPMPCQPCAMANLTNTGTFPVRLPSAPRRS